MSKRFRDRGTMMIAFITALIALIILMITAIYFRRKHIKAIGRLEKEKLQIQHKPILEEMTKVKQLNMTGETEEKFERWRSQWSEVMDVHMPSIDSLLLMLKISLIDFALRKQQKLKKLFMKRFSFAIKK